mmetsp:Transcript_24031/g.29081  ORF Transcript_24031/g.29081 Transcript_24031/m.29081 type:complete len:1668 (+) Transcript_24031:41-5044(+)|eukprot:CAMPEP_0197850620 /NCGR_PEP_ID=MMETSP1438-20131217/15909_1 /TAXON_ID=1461541 /ORGANISM="Pterosperma sp., Strain CCMP1384" /LENGTH=1667 /DNA_ID=CAMNT_0043463887 /DNA_START=41 /DNA_END=5044 /DNA_ORIENTATION=+
MRKPTDVRPEADLQGIQTAAAFKHIADAIEAYRRQFGLAFLVLIAFSAIHVGLVVIANLYTQQTRVNNGMLVASAGAAAPAPVATATATQSYDIGYIMSNLPVEEQKHMLTALKSVNFVDEAGDYRQYTVTGFKLGGHAHSELKLFTSVGHTLEYRRGQGFIVNGDDSCANSSASVSGGARKLLTSSNTATLQNLMADGIFVSTGVQCMDEVLLEEFSWVVMGSHWNHEWLAPNYGNADSHVEALLTNLANCVHHGTMQANVENALDDQKAALEQYLVQLSNEFSFADHFAGADSLQICVQGVTANIGGSCPFLTPGAMSSLQGISDASSVAALNWAFAPAGSHDLVTFNEEEIFDEDALNECTSQLSLTSFEYLTDLLATDSTGFSEFVASEFGDVVTFLDAVVTEAETATSAAGLGGITMDNILAPFGLTRSGGEFIISTDLSTSGNYIDPVDLTPGQEAAKDMVKPLLDAIRVAMQAHVDQGVKDCQQHNAEAMALAMVPMVQMTIEMLNSQTYVNLIHDQNIESMELAAEMGDTQLLNCKEAGELVWWCLNGGVNNWFDRQTISPLGLCLGDRHGWTLVDRRYAQENWVGEDRCYDIYHRRTSLITHEGQNEQFSATQNYYAYDDTLALADHAWGCSAVSEPAASNTAFFQSEGCNNNFLAMDSYHKLQQSWEDLLQDFNHMRTFEATAGVNNGLINGQNNALEVQNIIRFSVNKLLEGVFELTSQRDTDGYMVEGWYNEMVGNNNWDHAKTLTQNQLEDSNFENFNGLTAAEQATSEMFYGCTTELLYQLSDATTKLNIMAYDACDYDVSGHEHRKPFFTGTYFSMILGGFDSFSVYLPPTYCAAHQIIPDVSKAVADPSFSSMMDYVMLLHGWGGSSVFLTTMAGVLHFAFHGTPTDHAAGQGFNACATVADVGSGCKNVAYPGGFAILAPDGNTGPLGGRNWWMNSEFTGFVMDYVVFDLPNYMILHLGMGARSIGVFGFSMGAFGALSAVNTYTGNVAVIYAAAAPMYPNNCFFAYQCHMICATDLVYCELLFTSFGQVLNSYVIVWQDSLVVSASATDPLSSGIAFHMLKSGSGIVECGYYRLNEIDGQNFYGVGTVTTSAKDYKKDAKAVKDHSGTMVHDDEVFAGNTIGDYVGRLASTYSSCTYQNWDSSESHCTAADHAQHAANVALGEAPSQSAHVSLSGIDTTNGIFYCGGPDGSPNEACDLSRFEYVHAKVDGSDSQMAFKFDQIWHSHADYANQAQYSCFAAACPTSNWCVEQNLAEGSAGFLDPIKSVVAALKFVPFSDPVHSTAVPSAWGHFWNGMPLTKFLVMEEACPDNDAGSPCSALLGSVTTNNGYAQHPVLMFLHSAQNDQMGLYPIHVEFATIMLGAMALGHEHIHVESKFVADFNDCDGHFFTEGDVHDVVGWFSDAFHSFVSEEGDVLQTSRRVWDEVHVSELEIKIKLDVQTGHIASNAKPVHGLALCWFYSQGQETYGTNNDHALPGGPSVAPNGPVVSSPQPNIILNGASGTVVDFTAVSAGQSFFLHSEPCQRGVQMAGAMWDSMWNSAPSGDASGMDWHLYLGTGTPVAFPPMYSVEDWNAAELANEAEMEAASFSSLASATEAAFNDCPGTLFATVGEHVAAEGAAILVVEGVNLGNSLGNVHSIADEVSATGMC